MFHHTPSGPHRSRTTALAVWSLCMLAAVGLAACGGGGGSSLGVAPVADRQGTLSAPPPPASMATASAAPTTVSGQAQQAQANGDYTIDSAQPGEVIVTLPTQLSPGDTVSLVGQGANRWRIVQNDGQQILTSNLPGALSWVETGPGASGDLWWAVAASQDGRALAAAANAGALYLAHDGGASWQTGLPGERNWSALAMTADGSTLAASAYGGQIWLSRDGGATWSPAETAREWIAVGLSADGRYVVAADKHGRIHGSDDGGQTWTPRSAPGEWRSLAVSASGQFMVAGTNPGVVYFSDDYGHTWTPRDSGTGAWYRVAISADGQRVAAADSGSFVHTSSDWAITWTSRFREGPVNSLAMSGDGLALALAIPTDGGLPDGKVHISTDAGATWAGHLQDQTWRAVAFSGDGSTLIAAANGGRLYVSRGHRSTLGPGGGIGGGQGDSIVLVYLGDGKFTVREASGSFTVY